MKDTDKLKLLATYLVISVFLILAISLTQISYHLQTLSNRVQEDIVWDKTWDTTAYNADPLLPGTAPLYVLATDGYVIERWKPLAGFLDSSNFKHLLNFTQPQTLATDTNQDWRIFSLPILDADQPVGVITVSYYHPLAGSVDAVDADLLRASQIINDHVTVQDTQIVVSGLDERIVPHHISYQIVNHFNQIILKSNNSNSIDRLPNFIDPSYVAHQLKRTGFQLTQDQKSREVFVLFSQPLTTGSTNNSQVRGVIVVGRSIDSLLWLTLIYLASMIIISVMLFVWPVITGLWQSEKKKQLSNHRPVIDFDKKNALILIDQQRVPISFASNQYYLCEAVLSHRKKRWELDEIMTKFGEPIDSGSWRKVYDAMNLLNKKTFPFLKTKLVVLEDKTYRFNPVLLPPG